MSNAEEYFKGDDLAYDAWKAKYQLNNETLDEFFHRIGNEFQRKNNFLLDVPTDEQFEALSDYGKKRSNNFDTDYFYNLFKDFKYIVPGGSVLSGVGNGKPISLSNCFVLDTEDSIAAIFETTANMSQIYKRRGGVGVDLSVLRPAGAEVNNAAKTTGGIVPFMELFSQVTNTIGQEGRRGALMLSLDINHPDSPAFVEIKQNLSKVTGANISVKLNNEFKKAVENNEDYFLRWPTNKDLSIFSKEYLDVNYNQLTYIEDHTDNNSIIYIKKIKAKELWESIIQCAWATGEPGLLFWDNIIDNDPASVYPEFRAVSTNPCGEVPLSPYDSCRLIASNLYSLISYPFTKDAILNEELAYQIFYEAQIVADILVDLELEAVNRIISITSGEEQDLWYKILNIGSNGRRTGTGLMGLADMCAALGVSYGNLATIEEVMQIKQRAELDASIDLAILNGSFLAYDSSLEYDEMSIPMNEFFTHLQNTFPEQYYKMVKWGRRNSSFSTIAPTGTISIMAGVSGGGEPIFDLSYKRRKRCNPGEIADFIDQNGIGFKEYRVVHSKFKTWYIIASECEHCPEVALGVLQDASDEDMRKIIEASPWFGQTANDIDPSHRVKVQSMLQKYTTHSISSTVNVAKDVTPEFIATIYNDAWNSNCKGITIYRDTCRSGILVKHEKPLLTIRPDELICDVVHFKEEKKDWISVVGIMNNKPYEVFTGPKDLEVFPLPSTVSTGYIIKVKQGDEPSRYDFRYVDSYGYTNTIGGLSRVFNKEFWNYARFTSALLRNETPVDQVVKVLEGLNFTNKGMNSWKSGVIRSLKTYIPNGTEVHNEICDNCGGSHVIYESGCKVCKDCGISKCG